MDNRRRIEDGPWRASQTRSGRAGRQDPAARPWERGSMAGAARARVSR